MSTLYEINQQLLNMIDPETGEILDEEAFFELQMEKEEKLSNVALWILNLKSDIEQYQKEVARFQEKIAKTKKTSERLNKYLDSALQGNAWNDPQGRVSIKYRSSKAVVIDNEELLDDSFFTVTVEKKPDKVAIKNALAVGDVPGAHIEIRNNMRVE